MKKTTLIFLIVASFVLSGCSKDDIIGHYNNVVETIGSISLTKKMFLKGTKEEGIDDYTGSYVANYDGFNGKEYLFGGTTLMRDAGNQITVNYEITINNGKAELYWVIGNDKYLITSETSKGKEEYTIPSGGNYIVIKGKDFSGTLKITAK